MGIRGICRALIIPIAVALALTGSAAADDEQRGIDPNQGRSLVEIDLPSKAAAIQLQLQDDQFGADFNEHYLRQNDDGTVSQADGDLSALTFGLTATLIGWL